MESTNLNPDCSASKMLNESAKHQGEVYEVLDSRCMQSATRGGFTGTAAHGLDCYCVGCMRRAYNEKRSAGGLVTDSKSPTQHP